MKKGKKRYFVLLELLIALSIVTLCLVPLIAPQVKMTTQIMSWIEKKQLDRLADIAYAEVLEQLYENGDEKKSDRILWEQLSKNGAIFKREWPEPVVINYPKNRTAWVKRSYSIATVDEKNKASNDGFKRIMITIYFHMPSGKSSYYEYPLIIIKGKIKR
ncbi:MAG: type II secretion system protein [Parachlamydiales bacterium]|nr:type II secretion system protein [Parachlamydiales bacterium]